MRDSRGARGCTSGRTLGAQCAAASLLSLVLSGCPLSDDYFIDGASGGSLDASGGATAGAPAAGSGTGGVVSIGGAAVGAASGTGGDGQGGSSGGAGGVGASGGSGGTGGAGGSATASGGTAGTRGGTYGLGGSGEAGTGPVAGEGGGEGTCTVERERCDGLSNDCDEAIDEDGVCPTGCTANRFEGHLYLLCVSADEDGWQSYAEATTRCSEHGAELDLELELARVESQLENEFLKDWLVAAAPVKGMVWMGANDLDDEGTWVWGRGSTAQRFFDAWGQGGGTPYRERFNDFASGRPNSANEVDEDCGAFDSDVDWQWNDLKCSTARLGYVCEEQAAP